LTTRGSAQEFVPLARDRLEDNHWHYLVGGSETETTVKRNRLAIDSLGLRPRVLRRLPAIDLSVGTHRGG
jgi:glycolate oxidase